MYKRQVLNDKKDTSGQRFEVRSAGNGYYTITAEHSGKVLDVAGGSTASGAVLQQYFYNGSNAQLLSLIHIWVLSCWHLYSLSFYG